MVEEDIKRVKKQEEEKKKGDKNLIRSVSRYINPRSKIHQSKKKKRKEEKS